MKTRHTILALAFVSALPLTAQDVADPIKRDMVLEKDYDPQTENAGKIWSMPSLEAFKPQKTDIIFSTSENLLHLSNDASMLKAVEGMMELPDEWQKGYIRLGGGNHLHLIGDGQFNLLHTDNQWLDISLTHRSENRGTTNKAWDNDTRLSVNYAANTKHIGFKAAFSEEFCKWHYYAELPSDLVFIPESVLKMPDAQWMSNTKLHLQMASLPSDKAVDFGISLDENWFVLNGIYDYNATTSNGPKELDSDLKAHLKCHINDEWQARIDVRGRYMHVTDAPTQHASGYLYADLPASNFWFEIVPQVGYKWHLWSFFAGARFSKMTGNSYKFRVAPEIAASTPLWENASLHLAINGGERAFSFGEGFRENLYIDPTIRLLPEYIPIHIGAKLSWRPIEMLQLIPYAGYRLVKDMAQFYNATIYAAGGIPIQTFNETNRSFSALYANANNLYAGIEAVIDWSGKVRATADFRCNHWRASSVSGSAIDSDLNSYNLKRLDELFSDNGGKVWYKPAAELNARIDVNAIRNLAISLTYQMQLQRYAAVSFADTYASSDNLAFTRLDDMHLLNAEASYRLTSKIGIFLQANNLLNRTCGWWNRYDINGLTIAGGASITF